MGDSDTEQFVASLARDSQRTLLSAPWFPVRPSLDGWAAQDPIACSIAPSVSRGPLPLLSVSKFITVVSAFSRNPLLVFFNREEKSAMLSLKKIVGCVATVGVVLMLASTALASPQAWYWANSSGDWNAGSSTWSTDAGTAPYPGYQLTGNTDSYVLITGSSRFTPYTVPSTPATASAAAAYKSLGSNNGIFSTVHRRQADDFQIFQFGLRITPPAPRPDQVRCRSMAAR